MPESLKAGDLVTRARANLHHLQGSRSSSRLESANTWPNPGLWPSASRF